jgi:hypothetical protein
VREYVEVKRTDVREYVEVKRTDVLCNIRLATAFMSSVALCVRSYLQYTKRETKHQQRPDSPFMLVTVILPEVFSDADRK